MANGLVIPGEKQAAIDALQSIVERDITEATAPTAAPTRPTIPTTPDISGKFGFIQDQTLSTQPPVVTERREPGVFSKTDISGEAIIPTLPTEQVQAADLSQQLKNAKTALEGVAEKKIKQELKTIPDKDLPQERKQEIVKQAKERGNLIPLFRFLSDLGSTVAGRRPGSSDVFFDKLEAQRIQRFEAEEDKRVDSPISREFQFIASQLSSGRDFTKLNSVQIRKIIPGLQKILDNRRAEERISIARSDLEYKKNLAKAKLTNPKLKKLGAEQQKRLDSNALALAGIIRMKRALDIGVNTFSITSNDFTKGLAQFKEGFGRAQSGANIPESEKKDFRAMAPTFFESRKSQMQKLRQAFLEITARIKGFGFDPGEIMKLRGLDLGDFQLSKQTKKVGVFSKESRLEELLAKKSAGTLQQ